MKKKTCFVIMPFSDTQIILEDGTEKIIDSKTWDFIYKDWIKKAVESHPEEIICKRSPLKTGNFVKGIIEDIFQSDITIADLTGGKPNVYYELGIRHSLKNGTIIITQSSKDVPSDLQSYHYYLYKYTDKAHENEKNFQIFEESIHNYINQILDKQQDSDSPVMDYLHLNETNLLDVDYLKSNFENLVNSKYPLLSNAKALGLVHVENRFNNSATQLAPHDFYNQAQIETLTFALTAFSTFKYRINMVKDILDKGVKFSVLILNPDSQLLTRDINDKLPKQIDYISGGENIRNEILDVINKVNTNGFSNNPNFNLRFYDFKPNYLSLINDGNIIETTTSFPKKVGNARVQPLSHTQTLHSGLIIQFKEIGNDENSTFEIFNRDLKNIWQNSIDFRDTKHYIKRK
ncbi:hypothetical protein [uncultured Psychroserpens sp.]|uniref:hypothetical protein n=1 Tax=uncultured Psychroserpens sp. TaxID=255436 RepID=UPI00262DAE82|nr:hypothetical protein [uncultured Psychroserpens sp.]